MRWKKDRAFPSGVRRKAGFALEKQECFSQDRCLMEMLPVILSASLQAQEVGALCRPKGICKRISGAEIRVKA